MFLHFILMVVSLMTFLHDYHVSSCDQACTDKPVFTPSRLVVKYGDSTSATCVACKGDCHIFGLERSVGDVKINGTTLFWTVGKLTEWEPSPLCYYSTGDIQCCSKLPVTVYKPPERVSISFVNHTGPMFEHSQYTLQCSVENVAPVGNLVVTFYRGHTALGQQKSNRKPQIKPVSDTFTLNVNISREDDGSQYWCEAKLELGPEGPQHPPVVASENITTTVHWLDLTTTRWQPTTSPTKTTTRPTATTTTTRPTATTTTTTSVTTAKKSGGLKSGATIISIHRFIVCVMLLFSASV